jgi:hypothetical protein
LPHYVLIGNDATLYDCERLCKTAKDYERPLCSNCWAYPVVYLLVLPSVFQVLGFQLLGLGVRPNNLNWAVELATLMRCGVCVLKLRLRRTHLIYTVGGSRVL